MADNSKAIREEYQKEIDNKITTQLEDFRAQAKELQEAKDRYLMQHSKLKMSRAELKEINNIGEKENLDTTAYRFKVERDIDKQEEALKKLKHLADNYNKRLNALIKKHKEEVKAIKKEMFNALEEERAKRKREKAIIGE